MIVLKLLLALLVLSILIFIHELGHFLFAKWNKVNVLEFSIGFGKVIYQKVFGNTRYSLRMIPLGGYVKMAGDDYNKYYDGEEPVNSDEGFELEEVDKELEAIARREPDKWFFNKNILQRASIVFAGPLFNFLLAWVLVVFVSVTFGVSVPDNAPKIGGLIPDYPAIQAGLQEGDYIKKVGDKTVASWEELVDEIKTYQDSPVKLHVLRTDTYSVKEVDLTIIPKPESNEIKILNDTMGDQEKRYLIGIQGSFKKEEISFSEAMLGATLHVYHTSLTTLKGIWHLFVGNISPKHIGGPITIVEEAVKSADKGTERVLMFMVFISISLAVLNLLPIPVLDGGHLLLFLLEALNGGRLNKKFIGFANQFGMFVLLALMIFAIGNDLFRLVN